MLKTYMQRDTSLRYREQVSDKKLAVEHTLYIEPEGYEELHNEVGSQSPTQHSTLVGFELTTFQFCMLRVILLSQPSHMKNKN